MSKFLLVCFVLFSCCYVLASASLNWDRVLHTYFAFSPLPLTAMNATEEGWEPTSTCDSSVGVRYTKGGSAPSSTFPLTVYFTGGGQLAGFGVVISDTPADPVSDFWLQTDEGTYELIVSTRNASEQDLCSTAQSPEPVGDSLIVAQQAAAFPVPLYESDAAAQQWTNGSCLPKMGQHWAWDVTGEMTWNTSTLMPVMPMYWGGSLQTVLLNTPHLELTWPIGSFEGPFSSTLFCLNFCGDCQFPTSGWATMHFFLRDPSLVHCPSRC